VVVVPPVTASRIWEIDGLDGFDMAGCFIGRHDTRQPAMSNPIKPVDLQILEAVTGGTTTTPTTPDHSPVQLDQQRCAAPDAHRLSSTLNNLGQQLQQQRGADDDRGHDVRPADEPERQVNVFVRRPYW